MTAYAPLRLNLEHARIERNHVVRHAATLRSALAGYDGSENGGFLRAIGRPDLIEDGRFNGPGMNPDDLTVLGEILETEFRKWKTEARRLGALNKAYQEASA